MGAQGRNGHALQVDGGHREPGLYADGLVVQHGHFEGLGRVTQVRKLDSVRGSGQVGKPVLAEVVGQGGFRRTREQHIHAAHGLTSGRVRHSADDAAEVCERGLGRQEKEQQEGRGLFQGGQQVRRGGSGLRKTKILLPG